MGEIENVQNPHFNPLINNSQLKRLFKKATPAGYFNPLINNSQLKHANPVLCFICDFNPLINNSQLKLCG